ncbi:MAG: DUF2231 domain-containing protein [Caldilineaceae bacterium]|nr:DUF2231 domain-containing protein [Caldilineaceae bacterium]
MNLPVIHPIFLHFPIVLLISSSVTALAYLHWQPGPELRTLTWWMLPAGWFSLLLAIITGIVDQGGLPPDAPYRPLLNLHTTSGLVLALLYGDLLYRGWLHWSRQRSGTTKPGKPPLTVPVQPPHPTPPHSREGSGSAPPPQWGRFGGGKQPPLTGDFLDQPGRKWPLTIQLVLGIGLVIWSGWLGGELVYVWGVNVGK